eukprot:9032618-Pyramimonas_sp.AAC.1
MAKRGELYESDRSVTRCRETERTANTYETEVGRAMTRRMVSSRPLMRRFVRKMHVDEHRCGRCLTEGFPQLQLVAGHRLLEAEYVRDIHEAADIQLS